jgi:methylglyoxal synthase
MSINSIAIVAHDNKKKELIEWVKTNVDTLSTMDIYATGTTGKLIAEVFGDHKNINSLLSGPLGGDQQIGAKIAEGTIEMLIFFWDPLEAMPHDPDIKALLRIAVVWNIPLACNQASADYLIRSPLIKQPYFDQPPDFSAYNNRAI